MRKILFLMVLLIYINAVYSIYYPSTGNIQGIISNQTTGEKVTGLHTINISIYNQSNDAIRYSEEVSKTIGSDGVLDYIYGLQTVMNMNLFKDAIYFKIKIGSDVGNPANFTTVPYAAVSIFSNRTEYWDGLDSPADISISQLNNDIGLVNLTDVNNSIINIAFNGTLAYNSTFDNFLQIGDADKNCSVSGSCSNVAYDNELIGNCSSSGSCSSVAYLDQENTFTRNVTIQGNLNVIGESVNINVTNLNVNGSEYPYLDNIFSKGSDSLRYKDIYAYTFDGNLGCGNITDATSNLCTLTDTTVGNCSTSGSCAEIVYVGDSNKVLIQYQNISNIPTCSGSDKLTFDGTDLTCSADASGGGGAGTWYTDGTVQINTTTTGGVDDVNITGNLLVGGTMDGSLGCGNITDATSDLCTITDTDTTIGNCSVSQSCNEVLYWGDKTGNTTAEIQGVFSGSTNISIDSGVISVNGSFDPDGSDDLTTSTSWSGDLSGTGSSPTVINTQGISYTNITGSPWAVTTSVEDNITDHESNYQHGNSSTEVQSMINVSGLTYNISTPCSLLSQDAGGADTDFCNDADTNTQHPLNTTTIHNDTGSATINETYLLSYIQSNDNDTTVLNSLYNSTQLEEDTEGNLGIVLSWLTSWANSWFGGKTTDDLTEGTTNLYDNTSWNESLANTLYSTGEHIGNCSGDGDCGNVFYDSEWSTEIEYYWNDSEITNGTLQNNISAQYCSGTDKISSYDNGVFTCTSDETGGGGSSLSGDNYWIYNDTTTLYWNESRGNESYGRSYFFNRTSIAYTGSLSTAGLTGYEAANYICNDNFTNAHICQEYEIINTITYKNVSTLNDWTGVLWYAGGAPKYVPAPLPVDDCSGWTSSSSGVAGTFWDTSSNVGKVGLCDNARRIACCKVY